MFVRFEVAEGGRDEGLEGRDDRGELAAEIDAGVEGDGDIAIDLVVPSLTKEDILLLGCAALSVEVVAFFLPAEALANGKGGQ